MKQILIAASAAILLASPPAFAEQDPPPRDGPSLIEEGARMFFEGLMQEARPAMEGMKEMAERLGPQLREFAQEMGPALAEILKDVEDLSVYEAPEKLPNGDIIIRRKPESETAPELGTPGEDEIDI
ncbi:hypothetical protein DC366_02940 [Pelagivirga sediminicola]|uniref:AAA+ family ATPase n=1 Tax=Pelagivirga sediminicola TaxID=2170575 RepID=A0A2T7GBW2_9RHOB|nr:hypothetical protein [Pelagivirga sediminicola]PVA11901.1 hypothetical protein DC366_02940 [Pelagivirga sediminicola]